MFATIMLGGYNEGKNYGTKRGNRYGQKPQPEEKNAADPEFLFGEYRSHPPDHPAGPDCHAGKGGHPGRAEKPV